MGLSTWMTDMNAQIGGRQLRRVLIPGTHNSGTYGFVLPTSSTSKNQDLSVADQLANGARYFDFRVQPGRVFALGSSYPNDLYIHHGLCQEKGPLVSDILNDVAAFVNANPKELVILDFQALDTMSGLHTNLADLLMASFANLIAPQSLTPLNTLNQFLSGGRVVVLYNDKADGVPADFFTTYPFWPRSTRVVNPYANSTDTEDIINSIWNSSPCTNPNVLSVAQGLHTLGEWATVFHTGTSLQVYGEQNNGLVNWLSLWGADRFNIIILDYFENPNGELLSMVLRQQGSLAYKFVPAGPTVLGMSGLATMAASVGPVSFLAPMALGDGTIDVYMVNAAGIIWHTVYDNTQNVSGSKSFDNPLPSAGLYTAPPQNCPAFTGTAPGAATSVASLGAGTILFVTDTGALLAGNSTIVCQIGYVDHTIPGGNVSMFGRITALKALFVASTRDQYLMYHIFVVDGSGTILYGGRLQDGVPMGDMSLIPVQGWWPGTGPITVPQSAIGPVSFVACAFANAVDKQVHLLALDQGGKLWHLMRQNLQNPPTAFGDVQAQISTKIGPIAYVACATDPQDNLYVFAVDVSGHIFQTVRFAAAGTWQDFTPVTVANGLATRVACAFDSSGNLHVFATGTYVGSAVSAAG